LRGTAAQGERPYHRHHHPGFAWWSFHVTAGEGGDARGWRPPTRSRVSPCHLKEVGARGEAVLLAMVWNFRFENISATDLVISVFLLAEVRKFSLKIHLNIQKVVKYF
jgi:hypothetical protein